MSATDREGVGADPVVLARRSHRPSTQAGRRRRNLLILGAVLVLSFFMPIVIRSGRPGERKVILPSIDVLIEDRELLMLYPLLAGIAVMVLVAAPAPGGLSRSWRLVPGSFFSRWRPPVSGISRRCPSGKWGEVESAAYSLSLSSRDCLREAGRDGIGRAADPP